MIDSLPVFAAAVAAEVDRVFIAGHAAARPTVRSLAEQFGVGSFGILVDLRLPLLTNGGMSYEDARSIQRYADPAQTRAGMDEAVARGFARHRMARWIPTQLGQAVLDGLTTALADATSRLWSGQSEACLEVTRVAETVVDEVRESSEQLPAFRAVVGSGTPADSAAMYRCWWFVAALRYLRADDHASTWTEAGLDAVEVSLLTHLCHSDAAKGVNEIGDRVSWRPAVPAALERLRSREWVQEAEGGWKATEAGRSVRGDIEVQTNERNGARYRVLTAKERSGLLDSLRALRGI